MGAGYCLVSKVHLLYMNALHFLPFFLSLLFHGFHRVKHLQVPTQPLFYTDGQHILQVVTVIFSKCAFQMDLN